MGNIVEQGELLVQIAISDFLMQVTEEKSRLAAAKVTLLTEERRKKVGNLEGSEELNFSGAGELEELVEIKGGMKRALTMTLILVYALKAIPLNLYLTFELLFEYHAFVILSTID